MQKMQEMEQLANVQGLPTDRNTLNKLMALHPGLNNQISNNHNMVGRGALSGSAQAALALTSYQNRQNPMNSNSHSLQQEASSSFNNSNQSPSSNLQGTAGLISGSMQNLPASAFSSPHLPPQQPQQPQQLQQRSLSGNNLLQQNHPQTPHGNQVLQQQMLQQLLQMSNSSGVQQQSLGGPNANGSVARSGLGFGGNTTAAPAAMANASGSNGPAPSRSNSFKAASNSDSAAGGNNGFSQRSPDLPQNLHLQDDIVVPDISSDFTDNGFLNGDFDDNIGYGWKA
jgi:hypothetical protein